MKQDRAVIRDYVRLARVVAGENQTTAARRIGLTQSRFSQIEAAVNAGDSVAVEAAPYAKMLRYVIAHREAQFRDGAMLVVEELRAKLDELDARLTSTAEDPGVDDAVDEEGGEGGTEVA